MELRGTGMPCPSCGTENSVLDLRCTKCGAFMRDRVPALDLFAALWGMIEAPAGTLLRFARSEQKNYVHLLFALCGPLLMAIVLLSVRAGDHGLVFGYALGAVAITGPFLGLLLFPLLSWVMTHVLRWSFGLQLRYRLVAGYVAYATAPFMWASVIVLPLQLGLFGIALFSTNPAAWSLQPGPYWLLAVLDGIAVVWSVLLMPLSLRVHGIPYMRALLFPFALLLLLSALLAACGQVFASLFF